jgi:hypothetical protein
MQIIPKHPRDLTLDIFSGILINYPEKLVSLSRTINPYHRRWSRWKGENKKRQIKYISPFGWINLPERGFFVFGFKGSLKNKFTFSHPIFRPSLAISSRLGRDKILEIVPPLARWFCSIEMTRSDPNLGANSVPPRGDYF